MTRIAVLATRFRSALIAFVVLAMSATVAFAGGHGPSPASDAGRAIATEASGQQVPVRPGAVEDPASAPSEDSGEDAAVDENAQIDEEAEDGVETEDGAETDEEQPDPETDGDAADNHGALVSEAARTDPGEAWAGFNHGAFVSCVAKLHKSADWDPATFDLAALTPADCGYAAPAGDAASQTNRRDATGDKASKSERTKADGRGHGKGQSGNPGRAPGR